MKKKKFKPIPGRLGGLILWYDAKRGPVRGGTTTAAQWDDLSGNRNHATQTTVGFEPAITGRAGGNLLPAITFDGTDDHMDIGSLQNPAAGITAIMLINPSADAETVFFQQFDGGGTGKTMIKAHGASKFFSTFSFTSGSIASTTAPTVDLPLVFTYAGSTDSVEMNLDGTEIGTLTTDPNTSTGVWKLAEDKSNTRYPARIQEFVVYDRKLSPAEINDVEQYMIRKWKVS